MRVPTLLLAMALLTGTAAAQTISPLTGSTGTPARTDAQAPGAPAPAPIRPRAHRTMAQRFDAANTTHDGRLTLAQARAGHINAVARDFSAIDRDRKGYVTMDDIREHAKARRAARRAARPQQ